MSTERPFRKVFPTVATAKEMYQLFNRDADFPVEDRISGAAYAGGWFEITEESYQHMLEILPPLFMRAGIFGMSEFKAGSVTSVFFEITIRGRRRWFHGYCDLSDRQSPNRMRVAIVAFETQSFDSMTRAEKLEAIWARTHGDVRGIVGAANPEARPPEHRDRRILLVNGGAFGTVPKLLDQLTDAEIEEKLSAHSRWNGGEDDGRS